MSNKTQLQTNNTALDGYIDRINAAKQVAATLPESELDLSFYLDGTIGGVVVDKDISVLREGAFATCENLTKISLPNCIELSSTADIGRHLYGCKSLTTLELPNLTTIGSGNYALYGLESIERIDLPELTSIANFAGTFWNCKKVKVINMPKLSGSSIGTYAFRYCSKLEAVILGGDVLNPLTNSNAFNNGNSNFIIYVNDNLVDDYKTATNWTAFASRIKGISEWEAKQ